MEKKFREIAEELSAKFEDVSIGKMMSSPGIKTGKKVFAFYWDKQMVFKLGKDFDHSKLGLKEITFLNPFKNKGPMKAWIVLGEESSEKWPEFALFALNYTRNEK